MTAKFYPAFLFPLGIYRQIGIPVVILIRKTIATYSLIIFVPDQLNDFSHFSLRPRMQRAFVFRTYRHFYNLFG